MNDKDLERLEKTTTINDLYLIALQFTNYYEGWKHLKGEIKINKAEKRRKYD